MTFPGSHDAGTFSAFIIGALIGAGVALLLAPQSGAKTRGALRGYAARAKDELDEAWEGGDDAWDSAKDRGEEFVEKGKESLLEAGRQAKGAAEKAVHEATDAPAPQQR